MWALHSTFLLGKQATAGHDPPTNRRSTTATAWPERARVPCQQLASLAAAKDQSAKAVWCLHRILLSGRRCRGGDLSTQHRGYVAVSFATVNNNRSTGN